MSITKMLHIKYPIFLGAMAQIGTGKFVAAFSNAGGLGVIAAGGMSADVLRTEIGICKSLTNKPFAVNIMLLAHNASELAQVIVEENIKIVVTGAGSPAPYITQWKNAGMTIISVIASVKHATKVEALGVDIVVAEGTEAGGHVGESTTMTLVPQVVDAVSIPVIAAGGIGDGRGIVASLALGAQGVQLGTRFLAAEECPIHKNFKQMILKSSDTDTVVTGRSIGGPVRGIKNKMTEEFIKLEEKKASREEMETIALGALKKAVVDGDIENGSLMAGQITGMVTDIKSIEEIINGLISDVNELTHQIGLNRLFNQ